MSVRLRNPFYSGAAGGVAGGFDGIAQAIIAGMRPMWERDQAEARTNVLRGQAEQISRQNSGQSRLVGLLNDFDPMRAREMDRPDPGMVGPLPAMPAQQAVPRNIADAVAPMLAAGVEAGLSPERIGEAIRVRVANSGADDNAVVRALAGTGIKMGVNDAVSLPGQADVARRNQANDMERVRYQEGAQTGRTRLTIDAADRRAAAERDAGLVEYDTGRRDESGAPIIGVRSRADFMAVPEDQRPGVVSQGYVSMRNNERTNAVREKAATDRENSNLVAIPNEESPTGAINSRKIDAVGKPAFPPAGAREKEANPERWKDTENVDAEINAILGIRFDKNGAMTQDSRPNLPPDLRAKVRDRAMQIFARGGGGVNPTAAARQAVDELVDSSKIVSGGIFNRRDYTGEYSARGAPAGSPSAPAPKVQRWQRGPDGRPVPVVEY